MFRRDLKRGKPRRDARSGSAVTGVDSPSGGTRGSRSRESERTGEFVLYVEGPRDLEILGYWAKRLAPDLARCIDEKTVILGGKQPARAISDYGKRGGKRAGVAGLIVLDRDEHENSDHDEVRSAATAAGLEVFVWKRRHIESYLLVPHAIRRVVSLDTEDTRIEDLIRELEELDTSEEGSLHAKRILGANGALAETLGTEVTAGEIARAMRREDLHEDVLALFEHVRALSGLGQSGPEVEVIVRPARSSSSAPGSDA